MGTGPDETAQPIAQRDMNIKVWRPVIIVSAKLNLKCQSIIAKLDKAIATY